MRFDKYNDLWTKTTLNTVVDRITRKNTNNESNLPLTISAQYGLINQNEFFNKQIASRDLSNYILLEKGQFAYNKSYSSDYPWGAVKRLDKYDKGVLSSLYICFKPKSNIDSDFLVHYFETTKWYNEISNIAGEGARNHGLLNMAVSDYFITKHNFPSIQEQYKISQFLNLINQRIDTQSKIIEDLELCKKKICYAIFSAKESYVKPLGSVISYGKAGGTPASTNKSYYNGNIPFLSISDMTEQGKYILKTEKALSELGLKNSSAWLVPKNSLILSMYASVGFVSISKVELATSQAMFSMIIEDKNLLEYVYYYLNFFRSFKIHRLLETGTQSNINAEMVKNINIPFFDQTKNLFITQFFNNFDLKIKKEKDILELYKKQKAYLLKNMFI